MDGIWEALVGVGTTLTLSVIVLIAVGFNALALFYVSSAVVVLERFARIVRQPGWVLLFGAGVAGGATYLAQRQMAEAELEIGPTLPDVSLTVIAASSAVLALLAIGLCWLALRWLSPERLGTATLVALAAAGVLVIGAAGRIELALAPPIATGVVLAGVAFRRRRKIESTRRVGTAERQLRWLTLTLLLAPVLAISLPEPAPGLHAVGLSLLQIVFSLVVFGMLPLAAAGLVEMRKSAEWFLAIRYLTARRRQVYISAITLLCIGGIASGVWLIVTVQAVMNGFERAWREQIVGDLAHFTVHSGVGRISDYESVLEVLRDVPGVEAAAPYLDAEGMVRSADGRLFGVRMRGIDPSLANDVTDVTSRMLDGSLAGLVDSSDEGDGAQKHRTSGIVIGEPLADKLGVATGDELVLIAPFGGPMTPLGPAPRLKRFRIAGVFRSQLYQFGEVYTYVSLADAQDFVRAGDSVDGIETRTADLYTSRRIAEVARGRLGPPYYTRDWKDHFPSFFAALRDNRSMMTLLLGMIMVVAAFMIVATLMMMIMEKSADIAILKAMGADDALIERVFAIEGALIGLAGTTVGVLAGLIVTRRLDWVQETIETVTGVDTLPATIYQLSSLPADHDPVQVFAIVGMAMILALGATLVPARQGASFDPVEGLRSE